MSGRQGRVLVVDDEVDTRIGLVELLRQEGYDVESAADAFQALGTLASFAPELVVTDLMMPGMNGIELTKQLRAKEHPPAVIVMTASGAVSSAVDALRAGAADYLTKPLQFDELLLVANRVLKYQRLRREAAEAQDRVRAQLAFTNAMASSVGKGLVSIDLAGTITFINDVGAGLLGATSRDLLGKRSIDVAHVENGDGGKVECPLAVALRTATPVRSDSHVIVTRDGRRFPAAYTATPIRGDGDVKGAVIAFDDITEQRQAQDAEHFLLEASATLSASLDSATVVRTVARLAVARLGELCLVDLVSTDGDALRAWAHVDAAVPADLDLPVEPGERSPVLDKAIADVIATGRTARLPIVTDGWFVAGGRRRAIRGALIVPLTLGARQLGAVTLCTTGDRRYGDREVAFAEELARRSALAIEHARLYEQARHAVIMRDQTLAIVSHDLRTPLQAIVLVGEILREQGGTKDHAAAKIERAAERMDRMIGDLVDVASLNAGRLSIVAGPHAVAGIIDDSVTAFEAKATRRSVKLTCESSSGLARVQCDRDRVLQVIGNLLGNALGVSMPGDAVCLRAAVRDREVVFSVSDTGPGIAPADQKHLFEQYWRSAKASYHGTGLGLAIAHGIVSLHRGRIWVDSELGHGATFSFTIPLAEPVRASADRSEPAQERRC